MATCGSLRSLFENPLPEKNQTLIESLTSWNVHHKPAKSTDVPSIAEIFGELYFQEKPTSTPPPTLTPPPPPTLDQSPQAPPLENRYKFDALKSNGVFSKKNSESLQLCTEGLGSESSDDVDDLMESGDDWRSCSNREVGRRSLMYKGSNGYSKSGWDVKRNSRGFREFPPPISSIGKGGKPSVCLKSYREDGRFVLKEIKIPSQELLRASREDGRLKLRFVRPDEDIEEGEEGEDDGGGGGGGGDGYEDVVVEDEKNVSTILDDNN